MGGNFAKRRQGIILVTTVAIIVSLMSIIIISIMFYYYNNQILHQPVTAIASGVDKFGIREIYPTKSGREEWFMNMQDSTNDPRFDPQATITKNPDVLTKSQKQQ
ncbi:MAG: hypothetical protein ACJ712_02125 [Nitrososphaeraceae archaeon]